MNLKNCITNKTFDEINLGDSAKSNYTLRKEDIRLFALATGDMNPAHLDEAFAKNDMFHQIIGHGMWTGSLFSALLGMKLPGIGTIYLSQTLRFLHPVKLGDTITAIITATHKDDDKKTVTFSTICTNENGQNVVEGEVVVLPAKEKISWELKPIS